MQIITGTCIEDESSLSASLPFNCTGFSIRVVKCCVLNQTLYDFLCFYLVSLCSLPESTFMFFSSLFFIIFGKSSHYRKMKNIDSTISFVFAHVFVIL